MLQIRDPLLHRKTWCAVLRVLKRERENDGFRLGVQDFPFSGDAAGSRGRPVFEFQLSDAERRIVYAFEFAVVVARTILSDSRCYGYVLSLP